MNNMMNKHDDWEALREGCMQCVGCPLHATRTNVVFGVGNPDSPILIVGEGPGEQEDLQGEPFVGAAGKLLDDMLSIIDLDRKQCYIANIVKCRPPGNRDPLEEEQDACVGYLWDQITLIRPKIIVCLGRIAAKRLIDEDYRITRQHGTCQNDSVPVNAVADMDSHRIQSELPVPEQAGETDRHTFQCLQNRSSFLSL